MFLFNLLDIKFLSDIYIYARQQHPSYTDPIMIGLEGGGLFTRYVNYVN